MKVSVALLLGATIVFASGCATEDADLGATNESSSLRANEPIPGVDKPNQPGNVRTSPGWNW